MPVCQRKNLGSQKPTKYALKPPMVWANADGTDGIAIESTGGWTIPWSGSEPNNWGGNQDCMNFNDNFSNFNDNYCSATLNAFICEKRFYN